MDEVGDDEEIAAVLREADSLADSQVTLATIDTHAADELRESASNLGKKADAEHEAAASAEDSKGPDNNGASASSAANVLFHPPAAHEEHSEGSENDQDADAETMNSASAAGLAAAQPELETAASAAQPEPQKPSEPLDEGDDTASSVVAPGD